VDIDRAKGRQAASKGSITGGLELLMKINYVASRPDISTTSRNSETTERTGCKQSHKREGKKISDKQNLLLEIYKGGKSSGCCRKKEKRVGWEEKGLKGQQES